MFTPSTLSHSTSLVRSTPPPPAPSCVYGLLLFVPCLFVKASATRAASLFPNSAKITRSQSTRARSGCSEVRELSCSSSWPNVPLLNSLPGCDDRPVLKASLCVFWLLGKRWYNQGGLSDVQKFDLFSQTWSYETFQDRDDTNTRGVSSSAHHFFVFVLPFSLSSPHFSLRVFQAFLFESPSNGHLEEDACEKCCLPAIGSTNRLFQDLPRVARFFIPSFSFARSETKANRTFTL